MDEVYRGPPAHTYERQAAHLPHENALPKQMMPERIAGT
jgi:hypothetical protein